ncbi:MAG: STAS domain-containing protein [Planctomycetes bacterium]|nr:STAS domain-containing protein [Planctomycetota bacterium]
MQLQVRNDGGTLIVTLEGRLDVAAIQVIGDRFAFQATTHDGPVVVDCSAVTFLASLGIGMFVSAAKGLQRRGHALTLLRPQPMVEDVLRTTGLHNLVSIVHEEPPPRSVPK